MFSNKRQLMITKYLVTQYDNSKINRYLISYICMLGIEKLCHHLAHTMFMYKGNAVCR